MMRLYMALRRRRITFHHIIRLLYFLHRAHQKQQQHTTIRDEQPHYRFEASYKRVFCAAAQMLILIP